MIKRDFTRSVLKHPRAWSELLKADAKRLSKGGWSRAIVRARRRRNRHAAKLNRASRARLSMFEESGL